MLEAVTYVICKDDPVNPDTFYKIMSSNGMPAKILRIIDTDYDGEISVEDTMNFIVAWTSPR